MEGEFFYRFFHPIHYSYERQRFDSTAFQASSDGCSIVCAECARRVSGSACAHFHEHYRAEIRGEPPVYRRISRTDLPDGATFTQDASAGDECHYLINGLVKNFYRRFVIDNADLSEFEICGENGPRPLLIEDIEAQKAR